MSEEHRIEAYPSEVSVRSLSKREIDMRIVPWDTTINTKSGLEEFRRGAFEGIDPRRVLLMGTEHRAELGLGQTGEPMMVRVPTGRGTALEERDDAGYMTFKVAKTAAGDEQLALADEGIVAGVSVEFAEVPGGTSVENRSGRRVNVHRRVNLTGVSTTYRPAYEQAQVIAVRSEEESAVAEQDEAAVAAEAPAAPAPAYDFAPLTGAMSTLGEGMARITERLEKIEEQNRSQFTVPGTTEDTPKATLGIWANVALRLISGENVPQSELKARTVQELITTDNAGVVPEAFISELRGVIDPARPFMESTRRLPVPASGTTMRVPKITQRPTVAEQAEEKDELASQKTLISSDTFDMVSKGGVGDISLQLLKRSDPSFLDLYVRLLAEAYALEAEDEALRALFDATGGGITAASPLDPNNLSLGGAFQTSFNEIRRPPDTIWLSTEAVGEFIDAKATTTNQPLYSNIATSATAAGGITGTIQGLRAVHVPGLDAHGAFAVVGPSSGFAWAEDGTYTLQVDIPSKAGRDVAIFGMLWFVPWYPDAFTLYNVAS